MARNPTSLATGSISTTTLTEIYSPLTGEVVSPALVVTNTSAVQVEVSVFINNGTSDLLLTKKTIPAGSGKTWRVLELATQKLLSSHAIKIQLSAGSVNYFLSGNIAS